MAAGAILKRIPGAADVASLAIPTDLAVAELRHFLAIVAGERFDHNSSLLINLAKEVASRLGAIGYGRWARFWHYGRQLISLQHRLFIEQVYSDMGEPWSGLVTGFGTLDGGATGAEIRAAAKAASPRGPSRQVTGVEHERAVEAKRRRLNAFRKRRGGTGL